MVASPSVARLATQHPTADVLGKHQFAKADWISFQNQNLSFSFKKIDAHLIKIKGSTSSSSSSEIRLKLSHQLPENKLVEKMQGVAKHFFQYCKGWEGPIITISKIQAATKPQKEESKEESLSIEAFEAVLLKLEIEAAEMLEKATQEKVIEKESCCSCS